MGEKQWQQIRDLIIIIRRFPVRIVVGVVARSISAVIRRFFHIFYFISSEKRTVTNPNYVLNRSVFFFSFCSISRSVQVFNGTVYTFILKSSLAAVSVRIKRGICCTYTYSFGMQITMIRVWRIRIKTWPTSNFG